MTYTEKYSELVSLFNTECEEIKIPDSAISITNTGFESAEMCRSFFSGDDSGISENKRFSYPLFIPPDRTSRKVILLLHGLNERSWNKYLVWAYSLAASTGSYIVLFPISFHINRAPVSWKDPRSMLRFLNDRIMKTGVVRNSCFANIALSNRLSDDPRRFLKSGYQTVLDLVKLMNQIKTGGHPVIPGDSRINIFAYSIGAFMAEIIMMANPEGLFTESKLFLFCGGSVFSNMQGESKLIMDKLAYEKVYSYYMQSFEEEIIEKDNVLGSITNGDVGMAFRSMIDYDRFREVREKAIFRLRDQVYSISLKRDMVIPPAGIQKTLNPGKNGRGCRTEITDFPFMYTHENPFPVLRTGYSEVDKSFEYVFEAAGRYLA